MPNIKSAKKRVRVNATKAAANKARKSNLKTMIKKADLACTENAADKEAAIRVAIKKVDQACAKGLLHNIIQEIYACCFIYLIQKYIYTATLYMILYTKNGGADFAYNQQKSSFQFN